MKRIKLIEIDCKRGKVNKFKNKYKKGRTRQMINERIRKWIEKKKHQPKRIINEKTVNWKFKKELENE